jgi:hypothetical protein
MDNDKRLTVFAVGMVLVVASGGAFAQKACALVTKADAQSITSAKLGNANESQLAAMNLSTCSYLGPGKDSTPSVVVTLSDASKIYPGMNAATLKSAVFGKTDKSTTLIPGIGDAANYTQLSATKVVAKALVKGKIVDVQYEADDAATKKDQVIGLLKSAASRL